MLGPISNIILPLAWYTWSWTQPHCQMGKHETFKVQNIHVVRSTNHSLPRKPQIVPVPVSFQETDLTWKIRIAPATIDIALQHKAQTLHHIDRISLDIQKDDSWIIPTRQAIFRWGTSSIPCPGVHACWSCWYRATGFTMVYHGFTMVYHGLSSQFGRQGATMGWSNKRWLGKCPSWIHVESWKSSCRWDPEFQVQCFS